MTVFQTARPLSLIALCAVATGCASTGGPGLTIDYDKPQAVEAGAESADIEVEETTPVDPVTRTGALPLPDQRRPAPQFETPVSATSSPLERAGDANAQARFEPVEDGYINAIHIYPYVAGALYKLYAAPGQVSEIALQPGETLTSVSAGDTVRWVLGDTTSGTGTESRVHILVKPIRGNIDTNLVITTDRRVYHLELEATSGTYMASVSWHYPQDDFAQGSERITQTRSADTAAAIDTLRFRYAISGDDPPWAPLRAFDDGRKVYIQFPARLDQGQAPPLFALDASGEHQLVNYRVRGNYYIVDRLFAAAELRFGTEPQQVVRIVRTDAR